jgi:hypothetical protein
MAAPDPRHPEVVLRAGDRVSGLLTVGSDWNGWKVKAITEEGVDVEGHGASLRLALPRGQS